MKKPLFLNLINTGPAAEFATDDEAENYVLANPDRVALVIKNRLVASRFFGEIYKKNMIEICFED